MWQIALRLQDGFRQIVCNPKSLTGNPLACGQMIRSERQNRSALICVFPVFECIQFGLAFSPPHPLASLPARPPATPPPPSRPLSRTHTTTFLLHLILSPHLDSIP